MRIDSTEERLACLTADRRALHRIPESGYDLPETRAYLRAQLAELAPDELAPCDEGIRAVFRARASRRGAIALRADMDALLIPEQNEHGFCSQHPGMMHACGHDGHMAAMLMVARIVAARRAELERDVVLLFQPAEESLGGAKRMIDAGALENPRVEEVYGMHIMPTLPLGTIGCRAGAMMAAVDTWEIEIAGRAAHGATPQLGSDAIMAMASFIVGAQAALTRRIGPLEPAVLTVGSVESGKVYNVISERASLRGNLRTYDAGVSQRALAAVADALRAVDGLYGTRSEMKVIQSYPAVVNDAGCVARVRGCAGAAYREIEPVAISEDFSEFERCVPGAYFFCGCRDEAHAEQLHSPHFDFDERALLTGVSVFERLIFADSASSMPEGGAR